MTGEFVGPDASEIQAQPDGLLRRTIEVAASQAAAAEAQAMPTDRPESQKDGLLRRTEEVAERQRIAESNPDLRRVLIEELVNLQEIVKTIKPVPGETPEQHDYRIGQVIYNFTSEMASKYSQKSTQSPEVSEAFK